MTTKTETRTAKITKAEATKLTNGMRKAYGPVDKARLTLADRIAEAVPTGLQLVLNALAKVTGVRSTTADGRTFQTLMHPSESGFTSGQVDKLIHDLCDDKISLSKVTSYRNIGEVFGTSVEDHGVGSISAMADLATNVRNAVKGDDKLRTAIFTGSDFTTTKAVKDYKDAVKVANGRGSKNGPVTTTKDPNTILARKVEAAISEDDLTAMLLSMDDDFVIRLAKLAKVQAKAIKASRK